MSIYYLKMFVVSLLLTQVIELFILFLLREHNKKNVGLMILANILTNPAAVFLATWCTTFTRGMWQIVIQIPIEILVVLVEAYVYRSFAKCEGWNLKKPIRLAIVANTVSWLVGLIL